jgi:hypothetical protein
VQGSDGICSAVIKRVSTSFDSLEQRDLKEAVVRVEECMKEESKDRTGREIECRRKGEDGI